MIELLPRAVRNANAAGPWVDTENFREYESLKVFATVHAAPGGTGPTCVVIIEDSPDGGTTVSEIERFNQNAAGTTGRPALQRFGRWVRARIELGGTAPSYDVSVVAEED